MAKSPAGLREAQFKEIARRLVASERDARRYRGTFNLGQQVARALKEAYRLGLSDAVTGEPASEELAWVQVPAKSRDVLESIERAVRLLGVRTDWSDRVALGRRPSRKRIGYDEWVLLVKRGSEWETYDDWNWGPTTIKVLCDLDLLVAHENVAVFTEAAVGLLERRRAADLRQDDFLQAQDVGPKG